MKKKMLSFSCLALLVVLIFSSCSPSNYGPAFLNQRTTYMERPFGKEVSTQVYASAKFGDDATYKIAESNKNGELSVHFGINMPFYQFATGVSGMGGQYQNAAKNKFSYYGFNFRTHQNLKFMLGNRLEIQALGYGYSWSGEYGKYLALRFAPKGYDGLDSYDWGTQTVTTGLRYQPIKNLVLGIQYAYVSDNFFLLPPYNVNHCLSFSGKIGGSTLIVNLNIPRKGEEPTPQISRQTISVSFAQTLFKKSL